MCNTQPPHGGFFTSEGASMAPEQHFADQAASVGNFMQYFGAATAAVFGFLDQHAASIGLLIGALGFAINWYYKRRHDQREEKTTNARISALNRSQTPYYRPPGDDE
jgi:hypothetical protein